MSVVITINQKVVKSPGKSSIQYGRTRAQIILRAEKIGSVARNYSLQSLFDNIYKYDTPLEVGVGNFFNSSIN